MSRIEFKIVALGDFNNVQQAIAKLNQSVAVLNKNIAGVGLKSDQIKYIKDMTTAFDKAIMSSGQFSAKTIQLQTETEKFGHALESGKLKLTEYFRIIRDGSKQSQGALKNLAIEQTKLQNSIIVKDPLKGGAATVYTPTQINQVANATKIAANQQLLYNLALDRGATSLINWGKNTQWAGRQLTVGLTVPLTMFGAQTSRIFQQIDTELTRMQKVYGTGLAQPTQQALAAIRKDVTALAKELAQSWGVPIQETAGMAADLAATGKTGLDLVNATREAIRLAKLGEVDRQQAMQATVSLQNVYKLNTTQLAEAVNFLNAVENQTSTSLQDLVDAIPRVGPVVAQLGGSFKDTAAMMVAMKEAGVPAAQAANAIKSAMGSLINPSKDAKDTFSKFNIDLKAIGRDTGGKPVLMLKELAAQMKDLDRLSQAQLIEKLFGKFQFSRVQALLDNLNKAGSQAQTVFELMNASNQQLSSMAQAELKVQTESTTGRFKRAVESLKADLMPIGEQFTKVITKLVEFGDKIVEFANKLGPLKNVLGFIMGFVAVAGPIIMLTGVLGNFFGYILKGIAFFKNLANGTLGAGQAFKVLSAEQVAATSVSQIMNEELLMSAGSVDILTSAIVRLNQALDAMASSMGITMTNAADMATTAAVASEVIATNRGLRSVPAKNKKKTSKPRKFAQGGFVPGQGDTDTQPAMLTPGEFVVNKKAAQENHELLVQLNGNRNLGGTVTEGRINYGIPVPASSVNSVRQALGLGQITNNAGRNYQTKGSMGAVLGTNFSSLNSLMTVPEGKVQQAMAGQIGANPLDYLSSLKAGGSTTSITPFLEAMHQAGVITQKELTNLLHTFTTEYTTAVGKLSKINDINNPIANIARSNIERANNPQLTRLFSQFEQSPTSFVPDVLTAEQRSNLGLPEPRSRKGGGASGRSGAVKDVVLYKDDGTPIIIDKSNFKVAGGGKQSGFAHASSPRLEQLVQRAIKEGTVVQNSYDQARARAAERNREQNDPYMLGRSRRRRSPIPQAALDGQQDIQAYFKSFYAESARQQGSGPMGGPAGGKNPEEKGGRKGGRFGAGAGLFAASMGMSMLGDKVPGGSILSAGLTGASLGMGFGPWGAAAGAAIGLVVGGIGKLIEKEKELQAISDATFKSSTAVAQMFGGAVEDVSFHMSNLNNATPDFTGFSKEYKDFIDMVEKLPKDDPLSLFLKNIKGQTGGELQKTVRAFTDTQIALGNLDPSKASNYLKMILTYTGKMNEYNNVANGIAQTQSAAITSSLNALEKVNANISFRSGSGENTIVVTRLATKYNQLSHAQKTVVDSLGQFYNMASNATNIKTLDDVIKGIGDSAYNSADGFNLLRLYAEKMGDTGLINRLKQLQDAGIDFAKALLIIKAQSLGINTDTIIKNKVPFGSSPATRGGKTILEGLTNEQLTKLIENQFKEVDKILGTGTGTGTGGGGTGGTLDSLIASLEKHKSALEDEKAALDKSIQSQKEYNDQLQKTQDFLVKQTDLQNQIRVARAKGDYLQAGLLQQQLTSAQVTYNATASLSPAEQRSKDLQNAIDALTTEIRDANQKNKDLKKTKAASGGYIRSYGQGSWGGVFGPGNATSDSIPAMLSNGEYVLSASAVKNVPGGIKTLDGINSGNMSAFNSNVSNAYSIAVNVASSNASPDEIAQVVMRTIERRANMNSTLRVV